MAKTAQGLVDYAIKAVGCEYWYGCFGQLGSKDLYNAKKRQYPSHYTWEYKSSMAGKPKFDCVGLIKGYLWSSSFGATPKYNSAQDVSANGMYEKCKKKGHISTMPKVPGVLLFKNGHVGVYIGGNTVVEAKGHAYGVIRSNLVGSYWTHWGYCPWIDYGSTATTPNPAPKPTPKPSAPSYTVGNTYTLDVDLNVREGAGTQYAKKKRSQLTDDGKKHAKVGYYAILKKGTRVTCKAITRDGNDIWMRIPSGWVAAYYNGKRYVK